MGKFTETRLYKVMYRAYKNERFIDEYALGYFISKEEALTMVLDDMVQCGNSDIEIDPYKIVGIDGYDPSYKHVFRLHEIRVGRTVAHDSIEPLTNWDY